MADHADTPAIDLAYSQINALGGTVTDNDLHGKGYCQAVDDVLTILTKLGAKDAPYAALVAHLTPAPRVDQMVHGRLESEQDRNYRVHGLREEDIP